MERPRPEIIKALNALKSSYFDCPIWKIMGLSEEMANRLVDLGYATKTPLTKDPSNFCYRISPLGTQVLKAKPKPRPKLKTLEPRIKMMKSRFEK